MKKASKEAKITSEKIVQFWWTMNGHARWLVPSLIYVIGQYADELHNYFLYLEKEGKVGHFLVCLVLLCRWNVHYLLILISRERRTSGTFSCLFVLTLYVERTLFTNWKRRQASHVSVPDFLEIKPQTEN